MKKLLIQIDSSPHPSVFDRVVAFDGGADEVMSYGGVAEGDVRDLVHGAIFTRGPKDLHNTAIFVGGTDMAAGERLLSAVKKSFFGPLRVSVMLDSNGSNTTAVAAVARMAAAAGELHSKRAVVTAGTGPVGMRRRAAGQGRAQVTLTSRREAEPAFLEGLRQRFGGAVGAAVLEDADQAAAALEGAELLISAGPAGVRLISEGRLGRTCDPPCRGRPERRAAAGCRRRRSAGLGVERDGAIVYGALVWAA